MRRPAQLPRLVRLEQIQTRAPGSRIGLLVEERRRRAPDDVFFLFEDRAYDAGEVDERIDNVVRGLISIGVRQGEHVGVLMGPRPSALALVVAISRLGAVSVLLRPDGDVARRGAARPGASGSSPTPSAPPLAAGLGRVHTFVLGGGGGPRDLDDRGHHRHGAGSTRRRCRCRGWYRPNPGRAGDLAFIVFTGEGENTRMSRITNRRWAHVGVRDRVLGGADLRRHASTASRPLYHPSGLMMSIGGAIAGGVAAGDGPAVRRPRRSGRRSAATASPSPPTPGRCCDDLVEAPPQPAERHHPVRLFIGSGMPAGLWRRVEQRFRPARVVEFYASTEAGAILVNLRDAKPGSMGRPLPGSAEVRIAAYDFDAERPRARAGRVRAAVRRPTRSGCCSRACSPTTR